MGSADSELDSIFQDNKRHRNRLVPIGTFSKNPNFFLFFVSASFFCSIGSSEIVKCCISL